MKARTGQPASPLFRVVVGYEDYACGLRAMELYRRHLPEWENETEFRVCLWKFEPLGVPSLLDKAVSDALEANLIIVSLDGGRPLPVEARAWIETWRGQKLCEPAALALLINPDQRAHSCARSLRAYLETVARNAAIDFIAPELRAPAPLLLTDAPYSPRPLACAHDAWGINE